MRLLARGRQLGQDAAPVVRIGAPADQAVLLEAIHQLGDVGAHAVLARSQIGQGQGFLASSKKWSTASFARDNPVGLRAASRRPSTTSAALRNEKTRESAVGRRAPFRTRLRTASLWLTPGRSATRPPQRDTAAQCEHPR